MKHEPTMRCTRCGGSGKARGHIEVRPCPRCRGVGRESIANLPEIFDR
jgi:DnaJ-class molecular chaperone